MNERCPPEAIHLVGSGSKNRLLAQGCTRCDGIPVIADPSAATREHAYQGYRISQLMDLRAISRCCDLRAANYARLWDEADALPRCSVLADVC